MGSNLYHIHPKFNSRIHSIFGGCKGIGLLPSERSGQDMKGYWVDFSYGLVGSFHDSIQVNTSGSTGISKIILH